MPPVATHEASTLLPALPGRELEDFQLNYRVLNRGLYVQEAEIMTDDAGNQAVDSS